jgi:hypothetical protein
MFGIALAVAEIKLLGSTKAHVEGHHVHPRPGRLRIAGISWSVLQ